MLRIAVNYIAIFGLFLPLLAPLSGCGSSGGSSSSQSEETAPESGGDSESNSDDETEDGSELSVTHSVPGWMIGYWQVVRYRLGDDVSGRNMTMLVTETGFEYHYPGCDVYGVLSMDDSLPYYASIDYTLLMISVDCPTRWDIESFDGARDSGHIWADKGGMRFFRISDVYSAYAWVYLKL